MDVPAPPEQDADIEQEWLSLPGGPTGRVRARIIRPAGSVGPLPVILYVRGPGRLLDGDGTRTRLAGDLAVGADAAVLVPEYDLPPRSRYPVAIEQIYAAARWGAKQGGQAGLDASRMAVVGDSAGGNLAIALTLMAKQRGEIRLLHQVLFSPVTDAGCDTPSFARFASGYLLGRESMRWFWEHYTTTAQRAEITASPLRAALDQLAGLPPALIVTGEADVVHDEAEAYAAKLRAARVPVAAVRYLGTVHDFVAFDALRGTYASRTALIQAIDVLHVALHSHVH
ncbi:alpha/beta hydrolase [Nonomuraea sp. NBC_00507]|uniref:alpha/beta hydrolase n=1 Tax=Nonomuraea sp. NBC_00507 TaxID=2976002 RepID=UPI002E192F85